MKPSCVVSWSGRFVTCVAAAGVLTGAMFATVDSAEARSKKRHSSQHKTRIAPAATFTGASNYAALVVDAKTGAVLYEKNADNLRFPASVTKVMTLYLVFEDLERSRISLDSRITMSANCAAAAPSKLGLRPGQSLRVEDGIKALVTKSANDVACAFAENLEGSEAGFADRMTRKARAVGMSKTVFRNASGLPNPTHVSTARDLVTLGRAIQDRFPRYYGYFGTRVFNFAGRTMPNHNKLLGRVEGVDGIKTGYTNASGFNLLTSVKSQGRSIVAVVMGGRTGPSRDAHMRELIALNLPKAQSGSRTAPLVAENDRGSRSTRPAVMASVPTPLPLPAPLMPVREQQVADVPVPLPSPAPVASGATPKAVARALPPAEEPVAVASLPVEPEPAPAVAEVGQPMRWVVGTQPSVTGSVARKPDPVVAAVIEDREEAPARPVRVASATRDLDVAPRPAPTAERAPVRSGWMIQIGATTAPDQAQQLLSNAKAKGGAVLKRAEPFTETFTKGETTYYRARFAGLNERTAGAACKALKRSSVSCFAIKN